MHLWFLVTRVLVLTTVWLFRFKKRYGLMRDALNRTGRPIFFCVYNCPLRNRLELLVDCTLRFRFVGTPRNHGGWRHKGAFEMSLCLVRLSRQFPSL